MTADCPRHDDDDDDDAAMFRHIHHGVDPPPPPRPQLADGDETADRVNGSTLIFSRRRATPSNELFTRGDGEHAAIDSSMCYGCLAGMPL